MRNGGIPSKDCDRKILKQPKTQVLHGRSALLPLWWPDFGGAPLAFPIRIISSPWSQRNTKPRNVDCTQVFL